MQEYTFRFRNSGWCIEAEFSLQFDSVTGARAEARELARHSRFPIMEVKQSDVVVFHLDRTKDRSGAA